MIPHLYPEASRLAEGLTGVKFGSNLAWQWTNFRTSNRHEEV